METKYTFEAPKLVNTKFTIDFDKIFDIQTTWMTNDADDYDDINAALSNTEDRVDDFGFMFFDYMEEIGIEWSEIDFPSESSEDDKIGEIEEAYETYLNNRTGRNNNGEISW